MLSTSEHEAALKSLTLTAIKKIYMKRVLTEWLMKLKKKGLKKAYKQCQKQDYEVYHFKWPDL